MGIRAGLLTLAVCTATASGQDNSASTTIMLPDGRAAISQAVPTQTADVPNSPQTPDDILTAADKDYPAAPYVVRASAWSETDEKEFGQFVAEIGASGCASVNACLRDAHNPYRASDPAIVTFRSDCADFPYYLRFYFAWKRGLPFSFQSEVEPRGHTRDMRYSIMGNRVTGRIYPAGHNGYAILDFLRNAISSASYRIHPDLETPQEQDFYSPAITPEAIHPGTVIYDPNGHLAMVWKVEANGRIRYLDAHPDSAVTRGFYDIRFVRASPGMGAGFKNWRPQHLEGTHITLSANKDIADFSLTQFFGTGPKLEDQQWAEGRFTLNGEALGYYDYVRGALAGGTLRFDPLHEVGEMVDSNCADLGYRVQAVDLAIAAGLSHKEQPARLPANIYGTEGDWETYSTPSRDARLKTAFKALGDAVRRFSEMANRKDAKLAWQGTNLPANMLRVYDDHVARCTITYTRSDTSKIRLGYEDARHRLFAFSFDPYHCPERRWGARGLELKTCPDGALKAAWYEAEQPLRNQIDRTYDVPMGFTLGALKIPGAGKGVATPPDTDTRAWLVAAAKREATRLPPSAKPPAKPWWKIF